MQISILVRNHFRALTDCTVRPMAGNAYEVKIPRNAANDKTLRSDYSLERFDEAVFLVDDVESVQVMGSGESRNDVTVTVLL